MKLITFVGAGAFIFLSAFIIKKNNQPHSGLFDTRWALKTIHTDTGKLEVQTNAFIKFNKEKKSAGGNGSCNSFGSTLLTEGNAIRFSNIFSTKKFCEEVQQTENLFFGLLARADRYEVKGDTMQLFTGKSLLLTFAKQTEIVQQ